MSQSDEITDHQIDENVESHPQVMQGVVPKTKSNEKNKLKPSLSVSTDNTEAPRPIRTPTNKKEDTKNCKPRNAIGSDKMAHKLITENQPESIKTNRCKRCKTVCVLIFVLFIIGSIGGIYWTYHNPVESMWIMFRIAFWINTYFPIETVTEEEDIDESAKSTKAVVGEHGECAEQMKEIDLVWMERMFDYADRYGTDEEEMKKLLKGLKVEFKEEENTPKEETEQKNVELIVQNYRQFKGRAKLGLKNMINQDYGKIEENDKDCWAINRLVHPRKKEADEIAGTMKAVDMKMLKRMWKYLDRYFTLNYHPNKNEPKKKKKKKKKHHVMEFVNLFDLKALGVKGRLVRGLIWVKKGWIVELYAEHQPRVDSEWEKIFKNDYTKFEKVDNCQQYKSIYQPTKFCHEPKAEAKEEEEVASVFG